MENTLVWLLIFAGATIALLGVFLFASEKELKFKRREVEALAAKLSEAAESQGDTLDPEQPGAPPFSTELAARNKELSEQITVLTAKLEETQNQVRELQTVNSSLSTAQSEATQLHTAYQQLEEENLRLKADLANTESFQAAAITTQSYGHTAQATAELQELRAKLEESEARVRELEAAQSQSESLQNNETVHIEHEACLEARITALESELAREKEKLAGLESTRNRLAEIESLNRDLEHTSMLLEQELITVRQRASETEENSRRLLVARRSLDDLQLKQAALIEQQRKIQEETAALVQLFGDAAELSPQLELSTFHSVADPFEIDTPAGSESVPQKESGSVQKQLASTAPWAHASHVIEDDSTELQSEPGAASQERAQANNGKRSYKSLVVMIPILLITGTIAAGLLRSKDEQPERSTASALASPSAQVIAPQQMREGEPMEEIEPSEPPSRTLSSTATEYQEKSALHPASQELPDKRAPGAAQPLPRVWGGYRVVRPTQVYAEPNESAASVGLLDPGTQINVVGAQDAWLEIRSKHGRPPGFIKSDAAVRITQK